MNQGQQAPHWYLLDLGLLIINGSGDVKGINDY